MKQLTIDVTPELYQALFTAQTAIQGEHISQDERIQSTGEISWLMLKMRDLL